jgi:CheY-like chemotaxis protein
VSFSVLGRVAQYGAGPAAAAPDPTSLHGAAPASRREPAPADGHAAKARLVLVVDDDPSILRMLRVVFRGDGFDVLTATNGAEALEECERSQPDVVVLDLEMPVMDGREFFRELRRRGNAVPVLILSAYGSDRVRSELRADAFVNKPFEPDYLVSEVTRILG